jgi:septum formation protein
MMAVSLYLASASHRRRAILEQMGITHSVLPQYINEQRKPNEAPDDFVCRLAITKAETARASLKKDDLGACLGSDTTVVCKGEIFEKPVDEADALRILMALSGQTHQVMTAVALATQETTFVIQSVSEVTFRELSEAEIRAYWSSGEPADKAGAYGIQGLGAIFVSKIKGSYSGIMGLPVMETLCLLEEVGITPITILSQQA